MNYVAYMNTLASVANYSIMILTGAVCAVYLRDFLNRQWIAYLTGAVCAGMEILCYLAPFTVGNFVKSAAETLITFAVTVLPERRNVPQKIFLAGTFYALRFLSFSFFTQIDLFIADKLYSTQIMQENVTAILTAFSIGQILWAACNIGVLFGAVRVIGRVYRCECGEMTWKELAMLMVPVVVTWFAMPIVSAYYDLYMQGMAAGFILENLSANFYLFLYDVISFLAILILIVLYQKIKAQEEALQEQRLSKRRLQDMGSHIRQAERLYGELRSLRHDIGNHIQTVEYLVAQKDQEQAESYLAKLKEQLRRILPTATGSSVIDAILAEKMRDAAEKEIETDWDFHLPAVGSDKKTAESEFIFDLGIILSNALDNAIKAANGTKPYVALRSACKNNTYFITVKNSFTGILHLDPDSGLPETTGAGREHGIGMLNIRQTASKYLGEISMRQSDESVVLYVMMQIPPSLSAEKKI